MDIQNLTKEHIGKWVKYTPSAGESEVGRIKSWNDRWVFVVYNCDHNWSDYQDYTAAATNPKDLIFI